MTAVRLVYLWCDAADCDAEYGPGGMATAPSTRKEAATEGWKTLGRDDYCPKHAPVAEAMDDSRRRAWRGVT